MKSSLKSDGPPLYRQIADTLRYSIATGRLAPGEQLVPLRQAAGEWGVNLHTVRRAYSELAREGLVESRRAEGTRVIGPPPRAATEAEVDAFLTHFCDEAKERYGLDLYALNARLAQRSQVSATPTVWVVECSDNQCLDHAGELESAWRVAARPWSLAQEGEPGPGTVIATYFHYNDVRRRWPHRLPEVRFVAIQPDPQIIDRLSAWSPVDQTAERQVIQLCELDEAKAINIAADLSVLLPKERFDVRPRVVRRADELLAEGDGPVLFPPRVWGTLSAAERALPRTVELRYVIPPADLQTLGAGLGWQRLETIPPTGDPR